MRINKQKNSGRFIVFEGLDMSGKTTCIQSLLDQLKDNYPLAYLKGLDSSRWLGKLAMKYSSSFLFYLDLLWLTWFKINPYLKQGKIILQDRYYLSVASYVASADKPTNNNWLKFFKFLFREPDLIIYLTVDINQRLLRLQANLDNAYHLILFKQPQLIKLREEKYTQLLGSYAAKVLTIDTTHTLITTATQQITLVLNNLINPAYAPQPNNLQKDCCSGGRDYQ